MRINGILIQILADLLKHNIKFVVELLWGVDSLKKDGDKCQGST